MRQFKISIELHEPARRMKTKTGSKVANKGKNGPLNKSLQVGQDKRMDGMNERADTTELSMLVCRAWREENVCGRMKGGKISFEDL